MGRKVKENKAQPRASMSPKGQNLQVGAEDTAHLGDMIIFTVEVLVPGFHAEFPLARADGGWACAVTAESRGHWEGLHSGFSPERSFTYTKRMGMLLPARKAPPLWSPRSPSSLAPRPPLAKLLSVESFGNTAGSLPFSEHGLGIQPLPSRGHLTTTRFASTNSLG